MRKNIFTNLTALLICVIVIISQSAVLVYAADDNNYSGFRVTGGSFIGTSSAGAAQTLVFDGNTLSGLGDVSGGDLFVNFKGLMPGDESIQNIVIQNQSDEPISVSVYAEPANTSDYSAYNDINTFLSYFDMKVMHNTTELYDGKVVGNPTDTAWDRRNPIILGTISRGSQTTLTVTLNVDIMMPNGYQYGSGSIRWVFIINGEAYYIPFPPNPETPVYPYTPPTSPSVTPTPSRQIDVTPDPVPTPTVTPAAPEVIPEIVIEPEIVPLDNIPPVVIPESPAAEIIIDDPDVPLDGPKTGDTAKIVMWSILFVLFAAALVIMIVIKVRNGKKSDVSSEAVQTN